MDGLLDRVLLKEGGSCNRFNRPPAAAQEQSWDRLLRAFRAAAAEESSRRKKAHTASAATNHHGPNPSVAI